MQQADVRGGGNGAGSEAYSYDAEFRCVGRAAEALLARALPAPCVLPAPSVVQTSCAAAKCINNTTGAPPCIRPPLQRP